MHCDIEFVHDVELVSLGFLEHKEVVSFIIIETNYGTKSVVVF
jgi:hypothetical protein